MTMESLQSVLSIVYRKRIAAEYCVMLYSVTVLFLCCCISGGKFGTLFPVPCFLS